ncbi:hypothetical protein [Lactobacillus sp. ESL0228]|uniref:hypothetical protein n=1 Tax=Lactobacillus sp. ESL0228 TaxID=2069352 RepID=UPI000EFD95B3|nr:hypothetical protein [Lactobacillus sp. ESL0228]RMC49754.1 hypothetical protein F5ESL0228_03280 [Lactobacillus sp. ESL0228]
MNKRTLNDTLTNFLDFDNAIKFVNYVSRNDFDKANKVIDKLYSPEVSPEVFSLIYSSMLNNIEPWENLDLEKFDDYTKSKHKEFFDKLIILFGIAKWNNYRLFYAIKDLPFSENERKLIEKTVNENLITVVEKQQQPLSKKINDQKDKLVEQEGNLDKYTKKLDKYTKKLDKYTKKLDGVYSEFITILGIFTAITFAIFGGINTINSISSNLNISSNSPQNLGNLLIGAAVLGIVLFGIITVLFAGIAKITKKGYNLPPLLTISVLAIISAMFMIGLVFTFLASNWNLTIWPQFIISVVVIIAVVIFTKCKSNTSKKSSNNEKQTDNSSTSENN